MPLKPMSPWTKRILTAAISATLSLAALTGCSNLRPKPFEKHVFVIARQANLVDRVAAVSNRTGEVTNGEKLAVLDHARKFVKVRTPGGAIGWIKEDKVVDEALQGRFDQLEKDHAKDPTVGSATATNEVYLHIAPGRETDRFFLLEEGDKLQMLHRASLAKPLPPGSSPAPAADPGKPGETPAATAAAMEDWWLVRDAKGDTGWIYSRLMEVDAPDALARYAEGQRIVGAYLLANVEDTDSGMVANGNPVTSIPEYVTVLAPYKAGLPFDFDQVRVFTWNTRKHRYETAFREHNIAGYLPVTLALKADPYGKSADAATPMPSFTYKVLAGDQPIPQPDPVTGELKPGTTITKTYRLEGNLCRRIVAPNTQTPAEAHPTPEPDKKDKTKKGRKK